MNEITVIVKNFKWGHDGPGLQLQSKMFGDRVFAIIRMDHPDQTVHHIAPHAFYLVGAAISPQYVDLEINGVPHVLMGTSDGYTFSEEISEAQTDLEDLKDSLFCPQSGHAMAPLSTGEHLCVICKYRLTGFDAQEGGV